MTVPTFDEVTNGIASQGVNALKAVLMESWDALTPEERAECTHLMTTLVKARLYELIGRDVSDYLPVLNAAFDNWKVVGKQVVANAFKSVATQLFGFAGAFAGSAVLTVIKGIV